MNSILKRTVATFLTAGMLLSGLTACKTVENIKENSLINTFNNDTGVEFEKVLLFTAVKTKDVYELYIIGYDKISEEEKNGKIDLKNYKEAKYLISEDEYNKFIELAPEYDVYYPFSDESHAFLKKIIRKYDPEYVDTADLFPTAYPKLNRIVEEYCK